LRRAGELGPDLYIADETVQPTGAFKVRGAANALTSLTPEALRRGVVAVSTGNHGRAVAYVARELGASATVVVSTRVPENKLVALRAVGTTLVVRGDSQAEAADAAREYGQAEGAALIPPFDDPHVIAGQGALGLDVLEELPEVRTALVPLSGGGLIAGVGLAMKSVDPSIRVVGVSMEEGAAMYASLRAGATVDMPEADTLADSLQGGLGRDNRYTLRAVQELVDEVVLVSEAAIAEAMRHAFDHHSMVLEGAGAVTLAAVIQDGVDLAGATAVGAGSGPTVLIASGGNVSAEVFARVLQGDDGP